MNRVAHKARTPEKRPRAGVALLLVVVVLAALLSTSIAIFTVIFGESRISGEMTDSFRAIYAADLGMERMLYCDRTVPDPDCDPGTCLGDPAPPACTYPQPPVQTVALPLNLFPANTCVAVRLVRLGTGDTETTATAEYPCGGSASIKRALQTSYQK